METFSKGGGECLVGTSSFTFGFRCRYQTHKFQSHYGSGCGNANPVGWLKNSKRLTTSAGVVKIGLGNAALFPSKIINSVIMQSAPGGKEIEERHESQPVEREGVDKEGEGPSSNGPGDQEEHGDTLHNRGVENKKSNSNKNDKRGNGFFSVWKPSLPGNTPLRFFLSLLVLNILLNVWPMQKSPAPGYLPPGRYITIKLPFSDFLMNLKRNEISFIAIEGNHLKCKLKPEASVYASFKTDIDKSAIWFDTVKPRDYRLPYDTLMSNGARFTTIEKSIWGDVFNIMVCIAQCMPVRMISIFMQSLPYNLC